MERLLQWLAATRRNRSWLATEIGVSRSLVDEWQRGHCVPSIEHRAAIERVTRAWAGPVGWAVLASDWAPPARAARESA